MMKAHNTTELREAYYQLSMRNPAPDAEALDEIIREYPQFARELTDFAIDLAIEAMAEDKMPAFDPDAPLDPEVAYAMSQFQNALYEMDQKKLPEQKSVADPFVKLGRGDYSTVAEGIGANKAFLIKIRDRNISFSTFPAPFLERLTSALHTTMEVVIEHLQINRPVLATGQSFKADTKPVPGQQQSFEEAVRSSGLSEDQQKDLLSLVG